MKELGAVQLRQSLSKVFKTLERDGQPIALRLGRKRVGVIISVRDFNERFALKAAEEERQRLVDEILGEPLVCKTGVQTALDELRGR